MSIFTESYIIVGLQIIDLMSNRRFSVISNLLSNLDVSSRCNESSRQMHERGLSDYNSTCQILSDLQLCTERFL